MIVLRGTVPDFLTSTEHMDISDTATAREELDRDLALKARKPPGPAATGFCLFCDADVAEGLRWCDSDCRDDWERENR